MATNRFVVLVALGFIACGSHGNGGNGGNGGGGGGGVMPGGTLHLASPQFSLAPGAEVFKCWYTSIDSSVDLASIRMRSTMTPGSHHFIVYTTQNPVRPDGTFEDCPDQLGGSLSDIPVWLYASQNPTGQMDMPDGTALPLKAKQSVFFNMHYLNATPGTLSVQVTLDVDTTTSTSFQRVGAYVTYNTQISIPAGGTQTVSGDCDVPTNAQFFTMSTHSHKFTVEDVAAKMVNGAMGPTLVDTKDWEHASVTNWASPSYLSFAAGEKLHYQCSYNNTSANPVTVGQSASKNEMCMAIGYYFPATGTIYCLNSATYHF